ncbi:AsmA family protein [Methylovirgula sp. HY1]|uniref:AsmA family protein n=1 Tax=Methylovirgula sp. HY1 TaxID=2822761 RepID=UPI001C5B5BD7|nr:AsmA family protein [Methylovirgula sp. HY1]QXX73968.1 hypothetical protein MHY1_00769 [Methylovirgula sp. HY1]
MKETANAATARRRIRVLRVSWLIGIVVAGVIAAMVAGSFVLTAAVLNSDLTAQIRRATGFSTTIHGSAHFVLFPQPHIDIQNISFSNPQAGLRVDADGFVGDLRFLPLLSGRAEVGHAILYNPKMVIDLDDRPMTPESALGRAAEAKSASPEAAAIDTARLAIVDIVEGSARLTRRGSRRDLRIDKINVSIDWRRLDASATLTGQFDLHDAPMHLDLWLSQPVELLRGGQSAATVHLDSSPLKLLASGYIAAGQQFQYKGSLIASAPSLRKIAELAGLPFTKRGRFADLDLRCDANIIGNTAALTNLHLRLDGNEYEGTLALQTEAGTSSLSGTLATDLLDVTPFVEGLPRPREAYGRWSSKSLDLSDLDFTNLDLRLSAARLHFNDIKIKDAAISVLTRPGFLDLALAEAVANGGAVRGHLTLSADGKALDLRASGSATGMDMRPLLRGHEVRHPLLGSLSGSMVLASSGGNIDQLIRGLSGRVQIAVTNGQVVGVDLAAALRDGTRQPFAAAKDPAGHVTNFGAANFGLKIAQGVAGITDGRIRGDNLALRFGGSVDLADRALDLWALAQTITADGKPGVPNPPLWLGVKGPWDDLQVSTNRPATTDAPTTLAPTKVPNTPVAK